MEKTPAKIKRPLWVAGLNIALALTVGTTQAFAGNITSVAELLAVTGDSDYVLTKSLDLSTAGATSNAEAIQLAGVGDNVNFNGVPVLEGGIQAVGSTTYISEAFTGTLDGGGFTISGLTKPLFDEIGGDGFSSEISNLTLIANELTGVRGRGILANETLDGTEIVNVSGVGDVDGGADANVGGLVGTLGAGEISESSFTGDVTGTNTVGGLVGLAFGDITDSTFSGSVTGERYVGGIAGATGQPTISNSSASGNVTGLAGGEGNIGGLVGGGSATITDSHADVTVTGATDQQNIGGLLGSGDVSVTISNSYSTGTVTGDTKVGGLVGTLAGGYIEESYTTGDVFGRTNGSIGGLVGYAGEGFYYGTVRGIVAVTSEAPATLSSLIESSYATGDVTQIGSGNNGGGVGGLVGRLYSGTILNSYATGNVFGETTVGGLVGKVEQYGQNFGLTFEGAEYLNYYGLIENSYATGRINNGNNGANRLGGLVGTFSGGKIVNSYATAGGLGIDASSGCDHIGGLVGDGYGGAGIIQDSYAHIDGDLSAGCGYVGGLAGSMGAGSTITNSFAYVSGTVFGSDFAGGLIGLFIGDLDDVDNSYALVGNLQISEEATLKGSFTVWGEWNGGSWIFTPIDFTEEEEIELPALPSILSVVNTDYETEPFAVSSCFNLGLPYLTAMTTTYSNTCSVDEEASPQIDPSFLILQALDSLTKSVGFEVVNNELGKLDLAFLDQVKSDKSALIIGAQLFVGQSPSTFLSVGSLLQLEINFEANKSLQMWVKSSDNQYVLVGAITLDENGNAILPGIEFKKSGQYELVFVNSDKTDQTQPELVNKVSGLTVYVN